MRYDSSGKLILAPTDLSNHLGCHHLTNQERAAKSGNAERPDRYSPVIEALRETAPGIVIDVAASNTVQDLRRREADIAVRHVEPREPDLIAKLVAETSAHLYASHAYLERHGQPHAPADMSEHVFIGFETGDRLVTGLNALGLKLSADNFRAVSDNGVVAWEFVKRGIGIGVMLREVAELTPEVKPVLPSLEAIRVPVWLTTHRELHTARRIRVVFDALAAAFGSGGN